MTTVVVVEDDAPIRAGLVRSLSGLGYEAHGSATGLEGLSLVVDSHPDAVLLDLGLPDIDGLDLLRMIRAVSTVPVVVITARDDDDQIVRTLDAGADDYVVKPFSARQVDARVRAVLRRARPADAGAAVTVGALRVDPVDELDAAIDALLSNVFAHTPEGTPFSVQLRPTAPASLSWSLIVEDQGSETVTQPRTANGKHGGTGLGLDIVRRTAALAGGVAEIGRGTSGGYRVEVQLPVRTPEP